MITLNTQIKSFIVCEINNNITRSRDNLIISNVFSLFIVCWNRNRSAPVRELLSNNSLFVGQLYDLFLNKVQCI